nr:tetratricopeptide repeat protein [Variovorax sp. HW608]
MGCTVGQGLFAVSSASAIELRQRVETSRQRSTEELARTNEDNAQLRRSVLDLSNEIEQLHDELATLRGQNETLTHDIETMRMSEPAKVAVDGPEFVAEAAETQAFDAALAAFHKGNFAKAQVAFASFVRRYPQSGYKASALLWLGNCQLELMDVKSARRTFEDLVKAYPQSEAAGVAKERLARLRQRSPL